MNKTVKALLERQAERRRKRRVRALQNAACAVLAAVCILCLAQLDAEDRAAAMESESAPVQSIAYVAEPVREEPQEDPEAAQEPQPPDYIIEDVPLPADLQITLHDAAEEFGVDYELALAVIWQETNFQNVTGDGGNSIGYMQVQERFHGDRMADLGVTDLTDPCSNFRVGCSYLAEMIERYDGSTEMALVAYNAGPSGAYKHWFSNGVYSNQYSQSVLEYMEGLTNGND